MDITERLEVAKFEFIKATGKEPSILYLGTKELQELCTHSYLLLAPVRVRSVRKILSYGGCLVLEVHTDTHINYSIGGETYEQIKPTLDYLTNK